MNFEPTELANRLISTVASFAISISNSGCKSTAVFAMRLWEPEIIGHGYCTHVIEEVFRTI